MKTIPDLFLFRHIMWIGYSSSVVIPKKLSVNLFASRLSFKHANWPQKVKDVKLKWITTQVHFGQLVRVFKGNFGRRLSDNIDKNLEKKFYGIIYYVKKSG